MKIEIWSDIACPWCYIGKRRFEQALASFDGADDVTIVWRSFELDRGAKKSGDESLLEILSKKYGVSPAQARKMQERVSAAAAAEGLKFRFDDVKPGNTFDGHRLLHYAGTKNCQGAMKEQLLRAYFVDGIAISDTEALADVAAEAGLDADQAREVLASDDHADDVRADEEKARQLGVRGVPAFLIEGAISISGAQPPQVFREALQQAQHQGLGAKGDADAEAGPGCDDTGCTV